MLQSFSGIAEQAGIANTLSHEANRAAVDGSAQVARSAESIQTLSGAIESSAGSVQALANNSQESSSPTRNVLNRTPAMGVVKANTPSWLALCLRSRKIQIMKHSPATTTPW